MEFESTAEYTSLGAEIKEEERLERGYEAMGLRK